MTRKLSEIIGTEDVERSKLESGTELNIVNAYIYQGSNYDVARIDSVTDDIPSYYYSTAVAIVGIVKRLEAKAETYETPLECKAIERVSETGRTYLTLM